MTQLDDVALAHSRSGSISAVARRAKPSVVPSEAAERRTSGRGHVQTKSACDSQKTGPSEFVICGSPVVFERDRPTMSATGCKVGLICSALCSVWSLESEGWATAIRHIKHTPNIQSRVCLFDNFGNDGRCFGGQVDFRMLGSFCSFCNLL